MGCHRPSLYAAVVPAALGCGVPLRFTLPFRIRQPFSYISMVSLSTNTKEIDSRYIKDLLGHFSIKIT